MELSLPDTKTYVFTIPQNAQRQANVRQQLGTLGFRDWQFVMGRTGKGDYWRFIREDFVKVLLRPGPILILEDDVEVLPENYQARITLPDDTDVCYLGGGIVGSALGDLFARRVHGNIQYMPYDGDHHPAAYQELDSDWLRVMSMYFTHAVLFLTEAAKRAFCEVILDSPDEAVDVAHSFIQHRWNCILRKRPFWYQNDRHKHETRSYYQPRQHYRIHHGNSGLACNINGLLHTLRYRIPSGSTVEVDWTAEKTPHDERFFDFPYADTWGENVWTSLFLPLPAAAESAAVQDICHQPLGERLVPGEAWGLRSRDMYLGDQAWRREFHEVWQRWIKPRPEIDAAATKLIGGKRCVGIHYRLPIAQYEGPDDARIFRPIAPFSQYAAVAEALCPDAYFLATDDDRALQFFRARWGEKLIVQDCQRSSNPNLEVHRVRERHLLGTHLGVEAITDILALSKCQHFLHSLSNVPMTVAIINPDMQMHLQEAI